MSGLIESYAGETVLAVGAHPDDLEISAGGTLARLADAGAEVVMAVVCVPGDRQQRLREAQVAAEILGARLELVHQDACARVEDLKTHEVVAGVDRLIRRYEPAAVLTHSTQETHYDHVLTHRAVRSSMRLRPMDLFLYQPSTCKPSTQAWQPRIWVDISATIDRKLRAIAAHDSQFGRRGVCVDYFRQQAAMLGAPLGLHYSEGLDLVCLRG